MLSEPFVSARHRRCRQVLCVFAILFAAGASRARAQSCPPGTWTFVADSDGATADTGTTITLTFSSAGAAFAAVGPGRHLTGSGPCSAAGNRMTLQLPAIGKSVAGAPFTQNGNSLTLPFKMFSGGSGTSTWIRRPAPSETDGNGSNRGTGGNGGSSAGGSGSAGRTGSGGGNGSGSASPGGAPAGHEAGGAPSPSPAPRPGGGSAQAGNQTTANPYAPYVGDWVGNGWSYETRFRQSRTQFVSQLTHGVTDPLASRNGIDGTVMELTVEHVTHFVFSIDASGHVTGRGGIVYNLLPNLCGLSALVKQANESIDLMGKLPSIYKFANELGTAAISSYNKEWVENENRLADSMESLGEEVGKVKPPVAGIDTPYQPQPEIDNEVARALDDLGATRDTRALALQTIMTRCTGARPYGIVGGIPCSFITAPAVEQEVGSVAKEIGKESQEKLLDELNDVAKDAMEKVNRVEKHEELACGQVGPGTYEQFADQMKEKFTDLIGEEAKGAALGGLAGYVAGNVTTGVAGGLSVPVDLLLSIPGVTQVTYWYRGLVDGPDKSPQAERQFTIDGHLDVSGGTPKLYLAMGALSGGPSQLTIEYMVNSQWDQGHFPAFSPFLEQPADVRLPAATFHAAGTHRNGVAAWQEYEYNWVAHKVTGPLTEQPR